MLRYKTQTRPGLVALYDIRPGNRAGLFLQPGACTGPLRPRGHSFNLPMFKYDLTQSFIFTSLYDHRWIHIAMSVVALCCCVITLCLTKFNKLSLTYLLNIVMKTVLIPQCVGWYGNDALGTLFRGKPWRVLQCVVGQRSEVKPALIGVTQPWTTRHSQHLTHNTYTLRFNSHFSRWT